MLHRDIAAGFAARTEIKSGGYGSNIELYGAVVVDDRENINVIISENEDEIAHQLYNSFFQNNSISKIYKYFKWVDSENYLEEKEILTELFMKKLLLQYKTGEIETLEQSTYQNTDFLNIIENEGVYFFCCSYLNKHSKNKYFPIVFENWYKCLNSYGKTLIKDT